MQKWNDVVLSQFGTPVKGASVTVRNAGLLTSPTIYSDNGTSTVASSTVTADALGRYSFYAADGRYDLNISGAGITAYTESDIQLFDPTASNSAASINTVQSGIGALPRPVQDALRAIKRSGDYDTAGHFNTAADSLTETIGIKKLRFATGTLSSVTEFLRIPTADTAAGDFTIFLDDSTVSNGTRDNVFTWGYNLAGAAVAETAGETGIGFTVENNWCPSPGSNLTEFHLQGAYAYDGTNFRAETWSIDRSSTKEIRHLTGADYYAICDKTLANQAVAFSSISTSACAITFASGTTLSHAINNVAWLSQRNQLNSAYVELIRLNSSNQVLLAPGAGVTQVGGALYVSTIDSGIADNISFKTNAGTTQFRVNHQAGTIVEFIAAGGGAAGGGGYLTSAGQTNTNFKLTTAGTGRFDFFTDDFANQCFRLARIASAADFITIKGGVNGATVPTLFTDGGTNVPLTLQTKGSGTLKLDPASGDIQWGKALVALGGGAAPTLGTIGGSGPAAAAQNTWMRVLDSTGAAFFVPAWK